MLIYVLWSARHCISAFFLILTLVVKTVMEITADSYTVSHENVADIVFIVLKIMHVQIGCL